MPKMEALTFTKSIQSKTPGTSGIVNKSLSGSENKDKAQLVGADDYLVKFDPTLLFKEVSRFLAP